MRRRPILILIALAIAAAVAACAAPAGPGASAGPKEIKLAPLTALSPEIQKAPVPVRESYQFALANQAVMTQIPCYCGCSAQGHKSVKDCFVNQVKPDGTVIWDSMGFGWSICVDITRDVMRMSKEGKSVGEIRKYVDGYYSKFGPPTDTPPVTQ